jgi:hypothetical protein
MFFNIFEISYNYTFELLKQILGILEYHSNNQQSPLKYFKNEKFYILFFFKFNKP